MSFLRSKASRRPPAYRPAVVSVWPAITCASVTTMLGPATQPEPEIPRPHAVPSTRTTLGSAAPDLRVANDLRIRRIDRRQRPGDRRERIHPREGVQHVARRKQLVELLDDRRALHIPPELNLSRQLERNGREDPDHREPDHDAERQPPDGVDEPERARPEPLLDRDADGRGDQLHDNRTGGSADERDERRVGRLRAGRKHVRRQPRAEEGAHDHARRGQHAERQSLPKPQERRACDDRKDDPVEAGHLRGTLASLMDGTALEELIDRYNAAWNAHDVDAIVDLHTADSVFENHTTGDVNVGREAIGNAIRGIFTVFPDLEFETRRRYIRDDLVVQEWTARGTHLGKMNRAGMEVEPTGKTVEYRGMDVIPIADGLVARKDVYSDGVTLLRQLGLTAI